jgi:hypothetical protein
MLVDELDLQHTETQIQAESSHQNPRTPTLVNESPRLPDRD